MDEDYGDGRCTKKRPINFEFNNNNKFIEKVHDLFLKESKYYLPLTQEVREREYTQNKRIAEAAFIKK